MATTITDNYGKIILAIDSNTYNINKSDILSIDPEYKKNRIKLYLNTGVISGVKNLYINLSDVSTPLYSTIAGLYDFIFGIWLEPTKTYCEFLADEGQKVFDCNPRLDLSDSYKVNVDGVLQTSGQSESGNIVTFEIAPGDGAHIVISQ